WRQLLRECPSSYRPRAGCPVAEQQLLRVHLLDLVQEAILQPSSTSLESVDKVVYLFDDTTLSGRVMA
ncbi:MAG: hypothetical protein ABIS18_07405, partial [Actinomycetota bacterium]